MSYRRKTIDVETLKQYVNDFCLNSADDLKSAREQMGMMLETMLQGVGSYKGYKYLDMEAMSKSKEGVSVAIYFLIGDDGTKPSFMNTDHTRVQYY